jgi:hypothetical protein
MNRSLIMAVAIVSLSSVCFAQLAIGPALAPGQTLHGRFEQTRSLKGISSTLKSEGTFVLAPGRGLIWRIEDPIQMVTIISPAGIWQIINGSEVQSIDAAKVPFIVHFYNMLDGALVGDWIAMRRDFAVQTKGDRAAWRTVLTPVRPNDPIAGLLASIVITGGKMVDGVEISRSNGDSERIGFLDQSVSGVPLSAEDTRLLNNSNVRPAN